MEREPAMESRGLGCTQWPGKGAGGTQGFEGCHPAFFGSGAIEAGRIELPLHVGHRSASMVISIVRYLWPCAYASRQCRSPGGPKHGEALGSGSTKCEWCLVHEGKKKHLFTQGISPYFLSGVQIQERIEKDVFPKVKNYDIRQIFYYGTGCKSPVNRRIIKTAIKKVFPDSDILVDHDLMAAARALCGREKGIACILGTGSNSCYYNGKSILKNSI